MVSFSEVPAAGPIAPGLSRAGSVRRGALRTLRGGARFAGVVLILASVGIWMLNGPLWDAQMMLMRLAISVLFMGLGLMLLQSGRGRVSDEIHLDPVARELRHIQRGADGIARVRMRFALDDLGDVETGEGRLTLWSRRGEIVLDLPDLTQANLRMIDAAVRRIL